MCSSRSTFSPSLLVPRSQTAAAARKSQRERAFKPLAGRPTRTRLPRPRFPEHHRRLLRPDTPQQRERLYHIERSARWRSGVYSRHACRRVAQWCRCPARPNSARPAARSIHHLVHCIKCSVVEVVPSSQSLKETPPERAHGGAKVQGEPGKGGSPGPKRPMIEVPLGCVSRNRRRTSKIISDIIRRPEGGVPASISLRKCDTAPGPNSAIVSEADSRSRRRAPEQADREQRVRRRVLPRYDRQQDHPYHPDRIADSLKPCAERKIAPLPHGRFFRCGRRAIQDEERWRLSRDSKAIIWRANSRKLLETRSSQKIALNVTDANSPQSVIFSNRFDTLRDSCNP